MMQARILHREWNDQARAGLVDALGDDIDVIEHQVEQGRAQLWWMDPPSAWVVTRIEDRADGGGRELVIVAAQGEGLDQGLPAWQAVALEHGLASVRLHATRRGIERMVAKHGFEWLETVMRWEVPHGRQ